MFGVKLDVLGIQRKNIGFTIVLLRVKRIVNGFKMVLLRVRRKALVLQWLCLGLNEKQWFYNGFA